MAWEGLLAPLIFIVLPLFVYFYTRRVKYSYDKDKLKTDAKIEYIIPVTEGSTKQPRIRTIVCFDDGFEYSACNDSRTGLFTISASKEEQLEVAKAAIKKHNEVLLKELALEKNSLDEEIK